MKINTRLIKVGKYNIFPNDMEYRTINPPIYRGSTILVKYKDLEKSKPPFHGNMYGTYGNPAQLALEDAVCELEGGYKTRACISGINAIINTIFALTKQGDHILICDNVYAPTMDFCQNILSKFGVEATTLPPDAGENIVDFLKPNTSLIFMESPGSNTFEIQDIDPIVKIAKERNIPTIIDNTWATPLFFRPLEHGIDVSIMSGTKYISGHSDILLGTITSNEKYSEAITSFYETIETYVPSDCCYLALRGLRTMGIRLKYQEESALKIAQWLEGNDLVDIVIHPALQSFPQNELFKRYFTGSTGVFGFTLKNVYEESKLEQFFDSLQLFPVGLSWGGVNSLIKAETYPKRQYIREELKDKLIFRINVGLEDTEDLINDLDQGFKLLS